MFDMWAMSVAAFTALIFVVHFNLITRMSYITWLHIVSIFGASIIPYLIYMWISNYLPPEVSRTEHAVEQVHQSPLLYLQIACIIGICFFVDFAIHSYNTVLRPTPIDLLKSIINKGQSILNPEKRAQFD